MNKLSNKNHVLHQCFLLLTLILCLVSLNSCMYFRFLGTSEQKDESKEEIIEYLNFNNYSYDHSFMMIDSMWYLLNSDSLVLNLYKHENNVNASPIQLRVFDRNGNLASAYSQCYGDFKKRNILEKYPPLVIDYWPNNPNLKFNNELKLLDIDDIQKSQLISQSKGYDYTMVLYWNIWSNYFSRVVLDAASDYKLKHNANGESVQLILVNTAIQLTENKN